MGRSKNNRIETLKKFVEEAQKEWGRGFCQGKTEEVEFKNKKIKMQRLHLGNLKILEVKRGNP